MAQEANYCHHLYSSSYLVPDWDKPQWAVCIADMKHPLYLISTQNYNHQYSPVILTSFSTVPFIFHGTFLHQLYSMNALAVPATPIQTKTKKHSACWKPTCLHLILVYQYFWRKDQFQFFSFYNDLIHSTLFWLKNSTCQKGIICSFHPDQCFFIILSRILHSC